VGLVGGAGAFTCFSPASLNYGLTVGFALTTIGQGLQVNNGSTLNGVTTINESLTVTNTGPTFPNAQLQGGLTVSNRITNLNAGASIGGGLTVVSGSGTTTLNSGLSVNNNVATFFAGLTAGGSTTNMSSTTTTFNSPTINFNTSTNFNSGSTTNFNSGSTTNFIAGSALNILATNNQAPTAAALDISTKIATTAFAWSVLYRSDWFDVVNQGYYPFLLTYIVGLTDKMPSFQLLFRPTASLNYIYDITGQQSNSGYDQSYMICYDYSNQSQPYLRIRTGDNYVALTFSPTALVNTPYSAGQYQFVLRR
jgi:hypothetical protein